MRPFNFEASRSSHKLETNFQTMPRPSLTTSLDPLVFERWYWQKIELMAFCKAQGWPVSGAKSVLTERVLALLSKQDKPATTHTKQAAARMPDVLALESVIGPGWRLSRALREFFQQHHGQGFHFNQALRDFIFTQHGRTLAEALAHYQDALKQAPGSIGKQFQYNQHMREFFAKHPGASREQAIAAWWAWRGEAIKAVA